MPCNDFYTSGCNFPAFWEKSSENFGRLWKTAKYSSCFRSHLKKVGYPEVQYLETIQITIWPFDSMDWISLFKKNKSTSKNSEELREILRNTSKYYVWRLPRLWGQTIIKHLKIVVYPEVQYLEIIWINVGQFKVLNFPLQFLIKTEQNQTISDLFYFHYMYWISICNFLLQRNELKSFMKRMIMSESHMTRIENDLKQRKLIDLRA